MARQAVSFLVVMVLVVSLAAGCADIHTALNQCLGDDDVASLATANRCSFWTCVAEHGCSSDPTVLSNVARCKHSVSSNEAEAEILATNGTTNETVPASPCGASNQGRPWRLIDMQIWLLQTSMDLYFMRKEETYSENMTKRWIGINDHVCPPQAPEYSDCSSAVSWIYWTLFGSGPDFINNESWTGGYTGTLNQYGRPVENPSNTTLQIGDLCFYYDPMHHVTIYVGGGKVVSHGMDPVGHYPYDYAPLDYCRRYLVG